MYKSLAHARLCTFIILYILLVIISKTPVLKPLYSLLRINMLCASDAGKLAFLSLTFSDSRTCIQCLRPCPASSAHNVPARAAAFSVLTLQVAWDTKCFVSGLSIASLNSFLWILFLRETLKIILPPNFLSVSFYFLWFSENNFKFLHHNFVNTKEQL